MTMTSCVAPEARKPQLAMPRRPARHRETGRVGQEGDHAEFAAAGAEAGTLHELLALSVP